MVEIDEFAVFPIRAIPVTIIFVRFVKLIRSTLLYVTIRLRSGFLLTPLRMTLNDRERDERARRRTL